jgi:hypothetical protein
MTLWQFHAIRQGFVDFNSSAEEPGIEPPSDEQYEAMLARQQDEVAA